jgi:soluble lytic murein transglycosylase
MGADAAEVKGSSPHLSTPDSLLRAGAFLAPPADPQAALRAAEACATAPSTAARCRLVVGRARYLLGDLPGAAAAYASAVEAGLGDLEPHGLYLWGEALLLSGHPREALEPLKFAALGESPVAARAAALRADAYYEAGEFSAAASAADKADESELLPPPVRADLAATKALALCKVAEQGSKPGGRAGLVYQALVALRVLWHDFPDHPSATEAVACEARLSKLGFPVPPPPTGHDRLGRAQRLLSAGQPAQATAEAALARKALAAAKAPAADVAEAALLYARALSADGKRSEATSALEEAWKHGAGKVAAAAGLLLARDHSRRGKTKEAVALLDLLQKQHPDATEADDGAFLAARLVLDAGDAKEGEKRLAKLTARRSGAAAEARWALAWLSYRAGRADAAERFAAFVAAAEDDGARARGLYWQARAAPPDKATTLFHRAASLDPLGWYGLLAQQALGVPPPAPPPFPPVRAAAPGPAARRPALDLAQALLELGLRAEAAAELEVYLHAHHGDAEALLPALQALERAGRTDRSVLVAQQLLQGHPPPLEFRDPARAKAGAQDVTGRALLDLAYPSPYPREVLAAAQRSGLDPYLLLAVARRESVFRPDARSAAGAVGLLQLLPLTARRAAAVLGRPAPDAELNEPGAAIDLGAWYFSELVGRYGDPALAAAAYNAGPKAATVWVKKAQGQPLDLFVEEIPYRETRIYVKVVLGAWSAYRILAGGGAPRLAATVPAPVGGVEF